MEIKDKIEIVSKQIEVMHKKLLILLPTIAGTWIYGLKFSQNNSIFVNIFGYLFLIIFILAILGTIINYIELNIIKEKLKRFEDDG